MTLIATPLKRSSIMDERHTRDSYALSSRGTKRTLVLAG